MVKFFFTSVHLDTNVTVFSKILSQYRSGTREMVGITDLW